MSYGQLLLLILPVFAFMGIGLAMRRLHWLTHQADTSLLKMTVNFFYPCLILENVLGNQALREPGNIISAPLVGFGTIVFGILASYQAGRWLGMSAGKGLRTFAFTAGIYNYGYIPIPLMSKIFGPESLGILFVHNIGCEAAIWTVGILVLSGQSLTEGWRKLINAPVVTLILALIGNFLHLGELMPVVLRDIIHQSAVCAIPLGLVVIGATMEEYLGSPRELADAKITLSSTLLRLGLFPLAFIALAKYLPCSDDLKRVILIEGAMPAAVLPIVIAKHYGGQARLAVQVVLGTTALGILLVPLWIRLGLAWVF